MGRFGRESTKQRYKGYLLIINCSNHNFSAFLFLSDVRGGYFLMILHPAFYSFYVKSSFFSLWKENCENLMFHMFHFLFRCFALLLLLLFVRLVFKVPISCKSAKAVLW